jgi:hypothetical protein
MAGWYVSRTLFGSAYAGEARCRSVRPERETLVQSICPIRDVMGRQVESN